MYNDTVTVFNRYVDSLGNTIWHPHVLSGVNLIVDKAVITAKYGEISKDNAVMNVKYHVGDSAVMVGEKLYLPPKEWWNQTNDKLPETITFSNNGNNFDFFMLGDYGSEEAILDEYGDFYSEMQKRYDYVFAITSVAKYSVIPHFEITGK